MGTAVMGIGDAADALSGMLCPVPIEFAIPLMFVAALAALVAGSRWLSRPDRVRR